MREENLVAGSEYYISGSGLITDMEFTCLKLQQLAPPVYYML